MAVLTNSLQPFHPSFSIVPLIAVRLTTNGGGSIMPQRMLEDALSGTGSPVVTRAEAAPDGRISPQGMYAPSAHVKGNESICGLTLNPRRTTIAGFRMPSRWRRTDAHRAPRLIPMVHGLSSCQRHRGYSLRPRVVDRHPKAERSTLPRYIGAHRCFGNAFSRSDCWEAE